MIQDNKSASNPMRPRLHISITLQNTLLGNKYCIYQQIAKDSHSVTYLSRNIKDRRDYIVKFYQLSQLQNDKEVHLTRYRVLKQAQLFTQIDSPYVVKCYDVYGNQSYMAVVYEYLNGLSLKEEIELKVVSRDNYKTIVKHMYKAIQCIHFKSGMLVKKLDLGKIYFKNGYYKLRGFDMFLSQRQQHDLEIAPELHDFTELTTAQRKCDAWAIGLFYLKLLINNKISSQALSPLNKQCLYTHQLQVQIMLQIKQNDNALIRNCLMIDPDDRLLWQQLQDYGIFSSKQSLRSISNYGNYDEHEEENEQVTRTFLINNEQDQNVYQQNAKQNNILYFDQDRQTSRKPKYQLPNSQYYTSSLAISQFEFESLTKQDVKIHLSCKNNHEEEVYRNLQKYYFEAQKSNYIIRKLLMPIDFFNILDMCKKQNVEFMYLVSSRCFTSLSYVNVWLQDLETKVREENKNIIKSYEKNVSNIYKVCKKYFAKYSDLLTQAENNVLNMFRDRIKQLAHKEQKESFDKFLGGLEGIDYKKQEHLSFVCEKFIPKIIESMEQNDQVNERMKAALIPLLTKYKQLCDMQDSEQIRGKSFEESINYVIKSEGNLKNSMKREMNKCRKSKNQHKQSSGMQSRDQQHFQYSKLQQLKKSKSIR